MKLDKFPPAFKSELEQYTRQMLSDDSNRSYQRQNSIKSSVGEKPSGGLTVLMCTGIGFVAGFFPCVTNCYGITSVDTSVIWFLLTIGGLVFGGILSVIIKMSYNKRVKKMNLQISREESRANTSRENIKKNSEIKYSQYVSAFETTAQRMSVQFAESQLALEVIEWMTNGFVRIIDAADRRSHIESVNIPFNFNVYVNKITCNLGTYDFEIKRCRNLNNPLEQTALSRAIASSIQLNVTMKYPTDVSGTDVVTNITYSYGADYVSATLVYTARNGNFRAVRDWN